MAVAAGVDTENEGFGKFRKNLLEDLFYNSFRLDIVGFLRNT